MRKFTIFIETSIQDYMKSRDEILRDVRQVKSNGTTVVGIKPSPKSGRIIQFESSLESNFINMMEFSPFVLRLKSQPVQISYLDENGKKRSYTPDFLVHFRTDFGKKWSAPPTLFEVKYRKDIKSNWKKLKPKFLAALRYAYSQGWKFKIVTEVEINTIYTKNVKFLLPYKYRPIDSTLVAEVINAMEFLESGTPSELIVVAAKGEQRRAEIIPALWYLVANGMIGCNLDEPITMECIIWDMSIGNSVK